MAVLYASFARLYASPVRLCASLARCVVTGFLLVGLVGCGSQFAEIEGLPAQRVSSDTPWPRLIDTPAPPQDRLLATTGPRTLAALSTEGEAARDRRDAVPLPQSVGNELTARAVQLAERAEMLTAGVDRVALIQRAETLNAREAQAVGGQVDGDALARRGRELNARNAAATENRIDLAALNQRADSLASRNTALDYGGVDRAALERRGARLQALNASALSRASVDRAALERAGASTPRMAAPSSLVTGTDGAFANGKVSADAIRARANAAKAEPVNRERLAEKGAKTVDEPVLSERFSDRARKALENRKRIPEGN